MTLTRQDLRDYALLTGLILLGTGLTIGLLALVSYYVVPPLIHVST